MDPIQRGALIVIKSHVFRIQEYNPVSAICDMICHAEFRIVNTKAHIGSSWMGALYREHEGKPFYERLIQSVSGPLIAFHVVSSDKDESHEDMIVRPRDLVGATDPQLAKPGTIRKRFGSVLPFNAVHCSDSCESAHKELISFFT